MQNFFPINTLVIAPLIFLFAVSCQSKDDARSSDSHVNNNLELTPKMVEGKWGYADKTGELVIEPRFETAMPFNNDHVAIVEHGKGWGVIDKRGVFVAEPVYDAIREFSAGLAAVLRKNKWGYINTGGDIVIEPVFKAAYEFTSNGLAVVAVDANDWLFGYIDRSGSFVIEPSFVNADPFRDGEALVTTADGSAFYIDSLGNQIRSFDDGFSESQEDGGEMVKFEATFEDVSSFEGSWSVIFKDNYGNSLSFSRADIDIRSLGLFTEKRVEGTLLPDYVVNPDAVGKKYQIVYRVEVSDDNLAGEPLPVNILVEATPISN